MKKTLVSVFARPSLYAVFRAPSFFASASAFLPVVGGVVRVGLLEGLGDALGDLGVLHRVQPDVRVERELPALGVLLLGVLVRVLPAAVVVVVLDGAVVLQLRSARRRRSSSSTLGLGDGLVHGGLEALEVEHRVRASPQSGRSAWR